MELAPEVSRMMGERPAAKVWLATWPAEEVADFDELARQVGLKPLGRAWVEVDAVHAQQALVALLHQDLAHQSEAMTKPRAEWLAAEFLSHFGEHDVRFASNSADLPHSSALSYEPATQFTFDAGVAVIGKSRAGVYWVADEI